MFFCVAHSSSGICALAGELGRILSLKIQENGVPFGRRQLCERSKSWFGSSVSQDRASCAPDQTCRLHKLSGERSKGQDSARAPPSVMSWSKYNVIPY